MEDNERIVNHGFSLAIAVSVKVRILKQPTGTANGLSLGCYKVGGVYDLAPFLADYLVLEGFARVEMRTKDRPLSIQSLQVPSGVRTSTSSAQPSATSNRASFADKSRQSPTRTPDKSTPFKRSANLRTKRTRKTKG